MLKLKVLSIVLLALNFISGSHPRLLNNSALHNETMTKEREGEFVTGQDKRIIKAVRNILGRLMGGQSIVCTPLEDGSKITLVDSSSGKMGEMFCSLESSLILYLFPVAYISLALTVFLAGNKVYKWVKRNFW